MQREFAEFDMLIVGGGPRGPRGGYDAPEQRYCPADVYEIDREADASNPARRIKAQNCVPGKTCDIKGPT